MLRPRDHELRGDKAARCLYLGKGVAQSIKEGGKGKSINNNLADDNHMAGAGRAKDNDKVFQ